VRHDGAAGTTGNVCWFLTGSCNTARLNRDVEPKGIAKLCRVLTAGCHKQSGLNCTGREPFIVGRATAESMVSQRSMRGKPLYLAAQPRSTGMALKAMWRDPVGLDVSFWRLRVTHSMTGNPQSRHPEPPGVEHAT
jgi:hypothetical protein